MLVGGFVATSGLPWALKLFNGLIMDRFTFRPMGRRRVWIIIAQSVMVLTLIGLAILSPAPDQIGLLTMMVFTLNLCAVFNNVATDGMTIDLVPDAEKTRINGLMFASQTIGISATGLIGGHLLASGHISRFALIMALVAACASVFVCVFRERPGEKLLPWTAGQASAECEARQYAAWWPLLTGIFRAVLAPTVFLFLLGCFISISSEAFNATVAPTLAVQALGWESQQFSSFASLVGFGAAMFGAAIIPLAVKAVGLRAMLITLCLALCLITASAGASFPLWEDGRLFSTLLVVHIVLNVSAMIVSVVWAMRICHPALGASLFALFMAVPNFGLSVFSSAFGLVVETVGYSGAYYLVAVLSLVSLGVFLLGRFGDDVVAPERL